MRHKGQHHSSGIQGYLARVVIIAILLLGGPAVLRMSQARALPLEIESEPWVTNDEFVFRANLRDLDIRALIVAGLPETAGLENHQLDQIVSTVESTAYAYSINPHVLIALMQTQSSLPELKNPTGTTDAIVGTGEAYVTSFDQQVRAAGWILFGKLYENAEIDEQGITVLSDGAANSALRHYFQSTSGQSHEATISQIAIREFIGVFQSFQASLNEGPQPRGEVTMPDFRYPWLASEEWKLGSWGAHGGGFRVFPAGNSITAAPSLRDGLDFLPPIKYHDNRPGCDGPNTNPDRPQYCGDANRGKSPNWIIASAQGRVIYRGWSMVVVEHNSEWSTMYYHVAEDGMAALGDLPGSMRVGHPSNATTWGGYSSDSHVHFSIVKNGVLQSIVPYQSQLKKWDGGSIGVTLYEHANYGGYSRTLTESDYDLCDDPLDPSQPPVVPCFTAPSWTNNASAIKLAPGWQARLHRHNQQDADKWGDDASQGLDCNLDIADFAGISFPDGGPVDNEVSRVIVAKCAPDNSTLRSASSHDLVDVCQPDESPASHYARFVRDVTLPDGFVASPNQSLTKTWRIRNTGSATWGSGYQLAFVGGEQMGAPGAVNAPVVAPGQEANISVNITAPATSGQHKGYWQLRNPQGTFFGPKIWVEITIPGGGTVVTTDNQLTCVQNCPSTIPPGETFRPTLRATVGSGQLLPSRGDMIRHSGGELYGAWPHVVVPQVTNAGETVDFTFYADNPIKAPSTPGTYETKWRLWQNGDWASPEYTIRFEVKEVPVNHPPNKPNLVDPGDWGVFTSTPTLRAQANGDPDGDAVTQYYFDIFESHDIPKSGWINSSSWTPPNLGYYGYQWRVKVRDSKGAESEWSDVRHFNIKNPTPQIYSFSWQWCHEPWGAPDKICFCAETSGGGLELKLNSANDGSDSGTWKTIGHADTNMRCESDSDRPSNWGQLEYPAGQYRVRLYQRPNVGGWDAANTADVVVPVAANQRPGEPFGRFPDYGSYQSQTTIEFDWVDTYRTNSYRLQASTDSNFSTTLLDTTLQVGTSQYTHVFDAEYESIYWRVTASGPYGSHTSERMFHIDETPPSSAVFALPGTTTEPNFSVNWSGSDARAGLRWYHIQVRDGNRPEAEWVDWLVNTTKTAEIFQGQAGHHYYFRSRAMDEIGNWEAWPEGDGDASTLVDPSAVPEEAWWNDNWALKRNLIILNNDSDTIPAEYPMHIRFDSTTSPSAAEIYAASLTGVKGNDVRIVYRDQTQLTRYVQRFTPSQIDIWFPLQASLGSGRSDSTNYQLYYGHAAAGTPAAAVNDVFLPKADGNTKLLAHFQEASGSVIYDSSGQGHNGSFVSAGWADGYLGWAGNFNGSTSEVNFGNHSDFNLSAMTLEAWILVNKNTGFYEHIFNKDKYWIRLTGARGLHAKIFGSEPGWACPQLELNTWYHVAVTYNGSNRARIYLNGQRCHELIESRSPQTSSVDFRVGGAYNWSNTNFPGRIQHVRVSNIERTSFPYARIDIPPSTSSGVERSRPIAGAADLELLEVKTFPATSGGLIVEATLKNVGTRDTQNGFSIDLYVDHLPTGVGDYQGSVSFWINDKIEPDQVVTLTTELDASVLATSSRDSDLSQQANGELSGKLFAQADSSGAVTEPDDVNNIFSQGVDYCVANPDPFEDDGTVADSFVIGLGEIRGHNFDRLDDEDWVQFTAAAGKTYRLRTFDLGPQADTYLYLYDVDGTTLLASNDDDGESMASEIIWEAPADGTYFAVVTHWNPNAAGCGTQYSLEFSDATVSHTMMLAAGWNMVSSYVVPEAANMDAVFPLPQRSNLVLCKDDDGRIYWPEFNINSIGNWDPAAGYQCYTTQPITLTITGQPIDPTIAMNLPSGWSTIAYWQDSVMPVDQALASLGSAVVLVKNNDGQIYWPELNINTIGDMQPGQGYKIYLSAPGTLTYPAN